MNSEEHEEQEGEVILFPFGEFLAVPLDKVPVRYLMSAYYNKALRKYPDIEKYIKDNWQEFVDAYQGSHPERPLKVKGLRNYVFSRKKSI